MPKNLQEFALFAIFSAGVSGIGLSLWKIMETYKEQSKCYEMYRDLIEKMLNKMEKDSPDKDAE